MKQILMFSPTFFGYGERLANCLRKHGNAVDLYDERVSNSFLGKACIRYNIRLYYPIIESYISRIIQDNREKKYDYIFVIKGEGLTPKALTMLKKAFPRAKMILYLWDSVENIRDCKRRMVFYDRILTFDPADSKKYRNLIFRPLFYENEALDQSSEKIEKKYDIVFIGTAHSNRPRIVKQIEAQCKAAGRSMYVYFYTPHILVYLFNKITNPDFRWIKRKDIHTKPLSSEVVSRIYKEGKCALDIEHNRQNGLTIRTLELLGAKRKIMTTNALVKDYDFFNQNDFFVLDREKPEVDVNFIDSPYVPIPDEIRSQYSMESFLEDIFKFKDGNNEN